MENARIDQFVETGRAARELSVSAEGLRALEARGVIRAERTVGGRRLFRWQDVMTLKAERDAARDAGVPRFGPAGERTQKRARA